MPRTSPSVFPPRLCFLPTETISNLSLFSPRTVPPGGLAMLVIPGQHDRATCDGMTRREWLRVGGSALVGLTLADVFRLQGQARASTPASGGPGFNRARGIILIYLQGG